MLEGARRYTQALREKREKPQWDRWPPKEKRHLLLKSILFTVLVTPGAVLTVDALVDREVDRATDRALLRVDEGIRKSHALTDLRSGVKNFNELADAIREAAKAKNFNAGLAQLLLDYNIKVDPEEFFKLAQDPEKYLKNLEREQKKEQGVQNLQATTTLPDTTPSVSPRG